MKWWMRETLLIVLAFGVGVLLTTTFNSPYRKAPHAHRAIFNGSARQYPLINPLLTCGDYIEQTPGEIETLQTKVKNFISDQTKQRKVSDFSMYYRDLNNGPWFGINLEQEFTPGSLLKLPLLMSVLKQFETDPTLRLQQLVLREPVDQKQLIPPSNQLRPGSGYTYEELLDAMITESDNDATSLLYLHSDRKLYNDIFEDLGIDPPEIGSDYTINVQTYASFFRILYNATLISHESSEKALELLLKVKYRDGLVAGLPATVPVAHKFGEREVETNPGVVQLHDCGIVYADRSPYLICIMTRGQALRDLEETIARVSKLVYEAQVR